MSVLGPPIWPLPTPSQPFRPKGTRGASDGGHNGTDWPAAVGTPLHAMSTGRVVETGGPNVDSGNYVIVLDDDGSTRWSFSHMREHSLKETGQRVTEGEVLGVVGLTGKTTGGHVHVTTSVNHTTVDAETLTDPSRRGSGSGASDGGGGILSSPSLPAVVAIAGVGYLVWTLATSPAPRRA